MSAPFGIEIHSPLAALEVLQELSDHRYIVRPPKHHPRFDHYVVQATNDLGVVWVKGISADVEDDAYGFGVRALMDEVSAQLRRRYGPGRVQDFLMPGALWDGDREWVMSIHQNERSMSHMWESGPNQLPNDLEHIFLGITANGRDTAGLVIEYGAPDMQKVKEDFQDRMSDLL